MGDFCPNKSTPEWKILEEQVGSDLAMYTWLYYGNNIPNVQSSSKIKRDLRFRPNEERMERIYHNINVYNRKNSTSHYVSKVKSYGNTFDVTLHYNYLPVNIEKKRQQQMRRKDTFVVENFNSTGFNETFRPKPNDRLTSPAMDENIQSINEDGDVVHPDNIPMDMDYLVDDASLQISKTEQKRKKSIDAEIIKLKAQLNSTTDPLLTKGYLAKIQKLKNDSEDADKRIAVAKKINEEGDFTNVLMYAESQLKLVEEILSEDVVSADNILLAQRIINLWKKAGDFSEDPTKHIILDEDEVNTSDIRNSFRLKAGQAEDLERLLNPLKERYIVNFVNENIDTTLSKEEIFKNLKDAGMLTSNFLHLGRNEDAMVQALFAAVESANILAQNEATALWKELDSLTEKAISKAKGISPDKNPFRIYSQKTKSGLDTGKMVHRFSAEFFTKAQELKYQAFQKIDPKTGKKSGTKREIANYYKWMNQNTITFDYRKLFVDTDENGMIPAEFLFADNFSSDEKSKHINELKENLGEKGYEIYMKQLEAKFEKFKTMREVEWDRISGLSVSDDVKKTIFENWNKENSPFWYSEMLEKESLKTKKNGEYYNTFNAQKYTQEIPKKFIDGKRTEWYDSNFEKIENDVDLLNYYNHYMDLLKQMKSVLPQDKQKLMGMNDIPKMKQSLMDQYAEKGMLMGVLPFWNKMQEMITTTDLATIDNSDIDPFTGIKEKNINISYVEDVNQKINDLVKIKKIKYEQEFGATKGPITETIIKQLREEARHEIAQENSFDLTKIMKAYSVMALGYKHKSIIEPQVRMLEQAFKNRSEIQTNKAGKISTQNGKEIAQKGLSNLTKQFDFTLDTSFYNLGGRKVEGVSKKKAFTTLEKAKIKELNVLLENATSEEDRKLIQEKIDSIGGNVTGSAIGDMFLKYMTFKGLGWNVGSAFSNMSFGFISNLTNASETPADLKRMKRAYKKVVHSIGRNASFNTISTDEAIKIRSFMDKWDLMKTSNNELFEKSEKSSIKKGLGRFGPMTMQERSEYLNYAPIMISQMMAFKAKDADGNEVELWDAYDKDGQLKEGYTTDVNEVKLIRKIKRMIEMSHGDYNNALKVKATIGGRFLTQFRTWMFEGFATRFESEKIDYALSYGRDSEYIRKGRYRSYTAGQLTTAGIALGTTILPGIGTAVGAALGFGIGKIAGMKTDQSAINDTVFTLKQLVRKLMFKSTKFEDRFTETDAANMRKNMTELYFLMGVAGLTLLLTAMGGDDDDDKQFAANFLLNQMTRMQTDITFYTNPMEAEKLTKTAIPASQLLVDVVDWFGDVKNLYNEDLKDDTFRSGPFKGSSKALIHFGEMIPFAAQGIKLKRTATTLLK